jgi:hypothetical protein
VCNCDHRRHFHISTAASVLTKIDHTGAALGVKSDSDDASNFDGVCATEMAGESEAESKEEGADPSVDVPPIDLLARVPIHQQLRRMQRTLSSSAKIDWRSFSYEHQDGLRVGIGDARGTWPMLWPSGSVDASLVPPFSESVANTQR